MTKSGFFCRSIYWTRFALALILLSALTSCDRFDIFSVKPKRNTTASVQFTPTPGTYSSDQTVALTCATSGAAIYYTTDGTVPDETSAVYSTPIPVSGDGTSMTISAYAAAADMNDSAVVSGVFTIDWAQVSTPQILPSGGTYTSDQSVTITCSTFGATIYYTTDGTAPNTSSSVYSSPISVAGDPTTVTISAIAMASGMTDSTIASETYTIDYDQVATPEILPAGGIYSSDQSVTITCATPGATIYYTTDGMTPNTSSTVYSSAIPVNGDGTVMTISAMAIASGMSDSAVAAASYTIDYDQASTPSILPAGGTYTSDQSVTITCATSGATIYYTTDGSTPSTSSPVYSSAIPVSGNGTTMTVSAYAVATGYVDSTVASESYVIDYPYVVTPVISPAGGIYNSDQSVTITCATPGATIYYTTDGSTPTTSSSVYSSAIPVANNGTDRTINAYAVLSGNTDSAVATESYQIRYVVYCTLDDNICISYDGCANWNQVNFSSNTITRVFAYGDEIYVGGSSYLNYYDGSSWNVRTFSGDVTCLFLDSNYHYLYISTYGDGMRRSPDNGESYDVNTLSLQSQRAVYTVNGIAFLATDNGLYYNDDVATPSMFSYSGSSYSPITTTDGLGSNDVYDVYVIGNDRYLATASGVSVYSDTGTDPGTCVNHTTSTGGITYGVCSDGINIYAATANGLSIYNGSTWSDAITSIQCNRVRKSGSIIYVATDNGLRFSDDEGATWNVFASVKVIRDVCVSPQ